MSTVIFFLGFLLAFIYPSFATQGDEDCSQSLSMSSEVSSLILEEEDLNNLEKYIEQLRENNIQTEKIFFQDQKKYILKFEPINPFFPGFVDDYANFLAIFPSLKILSVSLDISYRHLYLNELNQAIELAQNNSFLVGFNFQKIPDWKIGKINKWKQQHILNALTYRNALIRGVNKDINYCFYLESDEEENIISEGINQSFFIKRLNVVFRENIKKNIFKSAAGIPSLKSAHFDMGIHNISPYLFPFIKKTPSLNFLTLKYISDDQILNGLAGILNEKLNSLRGIQLIFLRDMRGVTESAFINFLQAVASNECLHTLQLDNIPLSNPQIIIDSFQNSTTLRRLIFRSRHIEEESVRILCERLKGDRNLEIKLIIPEEDN